MGVGGTTVGSHPDLVFADDLVTESNCDSVAEQEYLWDYVQAFQPLLPDRGAIVLNGTRWSEIDVYGRVESLNEAARRAGKSEADLPWQTYVKQAYVAREDGTLDLYFPAYLTQARLDDLRSKVDSRKYNAWFFNRMVDPSEKTFKGENLILFHGTYKFSPPYRRAVTLLNPEYGGEVVPLYVVCS